jgi:glycosyltransferase involved in cell wall biosynthesis
MAYFGIIIPNYNNADYIEKCVNSVIRQTFEDFDIVIVDDCSTDNSIEKIKALEEKDFRITYFQNDEKAFNGGTRNYGIEDIKCVMDADSYIMFLDSDDWFIDENVLQDIYDTIQKNNEPDCVRLSYMYHKNGTDTPVILNETSVEDMVKNVNVACWLKVVKAELVEPVFPENTLMEDVIYHIKQCDKIESVVPLGRPAIVWNRDNVNSCSQNRTLQNNKWYSSMYRYIADLIETRCEHEYCNNEASERLSSALRNLRAGIMSQDKIQ